MIAFVVAAALAGGFSYLVFQRIQNTAAERPKTIKIVAAARDLRQGIALTAEDVVLIDWPEDLALAGSMAKTEQVIGRPLMTQISERRPILDRDLAAAGSGIGLTVKIPMGMRATAVRSNEIVGVAGFLFPGSHVDVLATYNPPNNNGGSVTQTVLQNVEVLTTGTATEPDPQGKPQTVSVVTLLLNPEDSQRLLLTSTQGTIQFVLRSGADQEKVTVYPTRLEQILVGDRPPAPVVPVRAAPRPAPRKDPEPKAVEPPKPVETAKPPEAPKPQVHRLEIIQGTQRSIREF